MKLQQARGRFGSQTNKLILGVLTALLITGVIGVWLQQARALNIWSPSQTPAVETESDTAAVELGMKFRSSVATTVTGVKFYKGVDNTGAHSGSLWSSAGTRLATVNFSNETASGWQTATFATPVAITANTTYIISYFAPNGHYSVDSGYFANKSASNGTLTALQSGTDGDNGVFKYGSTSAFPSESYNASNYWVDVIVGSAPVSDTVAPSVNLSAPVGGATVSGMTTLAATASDNIGVRSVQFKLDGVSIGNADTTSPYNVSWNTATAANGTHQLSAVATDTSGNTTTSPVVTVTVSNQVTPTSSLWPNTVVPAVKSDQETSPIELGMKFRSSVATTVTGVKFYKGTGNTGLHSGSLWSSNGTRLATVTFTNESSTGWQAATFPTPVAIAANTTYVISYFAPNGRYAIDTGYFSSARTSGTLTGLQSGTDGDNGVFKYGSTSAFPDTSWNNSNYWVDVVVAGAAAPVDTTAPTISATSPVSNATAVAVDANVTATASESLSATTVTTSSVILKDAQNATVAATVTYDAATKKITFNPTADLDPSTQYTATLTTALKDVAGNALASAYSWSFTTQVAPVAPIDPLAQGHDGPILVITKTGSPFSAYYSEILRAEGLNSFKTVEIGSVTAALLAQYDVAILGDFDISTAQVTTLTSWVTSGGNLIAMSPDKKLASLLGLTDQSATLADTYLKVNTSTTPGAGITSHTMQFHGSAERYTANTGTSTVATLYSNATTATSNPAVTIRAVGSNGGQAVAFTYDLARSVVYTHQGNPAWSGDDRDGNGVIRPNDLFYGNKAGDSQSDYVDLAKVAIPQADEQQRLLANIIGEVNKDRKPLPKLSYFPYNKKAVVVLTSDDHANGTSTISGLDHQLAQSPTGCSVADWECIRSTSLIYTNTDLSNAQALAYYNQGFDFGVHSSTGCNNWTPASLGEALDADLTAFRAKYTSLPTQNANRIHCIAWSDYVSAAKIEAQKNMRIDLNYYYWPGSWVQNRPGFMTGSGMSMRFADTDGSMINTYQVPSHLVNESGQTFPQNIDTMLERALGAEGYYGVLATHYDYSDPFDRQLIQSAKARNVPLVSTKQLLDWNDGRNASYFTNSSWSGTTLNFTATIDSKLRQMGRALLPLSAKGNTTLLTINRNGTPVQYTIETMKGVTYAVFPVVSGSYSAVYGQDTTAPTVTAVSPTNNATGVALSSSITVTTSEPLQPTAVTNTSARLLSGTTTVPATLTYIPGSNTITIDPTTNLAANTQYTVSLSGSITDTSGIALAPYTSSFRTGENSFSLWAPNAQTVSQSSDSDLEVGLKFQSSQAGSITKIHFYKSPNDTSTTHTVTLWGANGANLGTATTQSETASGWQQASFATPISITSGTIYTASYRASNGQISYTAGVLAAPVANGPLSTPAGAGVFVYGGGYPTQMHNNTNYWVDVTFIAQ